MTDPLRPAGSGASAARGVEAGERTGSDGLLTIGQVVDLLRPEFEDLSISKVRYLEDRDLIAPQRTPGGYRKYSRSEVQRLRTILHLQRDEFLPLEVIRERMSQGTASTVGRALVTASPLDAPDILHREEALYAWDEVQDLTGVGGDFLRRLAEFGLVEKGSATEVGPTLSETDVEITRICDLLARYGVEPRNLRLLRSSAEREAAMVQQIVAPTLRSSHEERRAEAEKTLQALGSLLARLLDLLLYKELRRLVG
ncbi:MAG: MerR family transcriptional regulator [Thermoleophilia bacterium]|nr:MerR family transcriptional regulator [Thermoleophilia bacterium]